MSYDDLLIHTCYLMTRASSQNYLGEWTYTWTTSTTATECRMSPVSAREQQESYGLYDNVRYTCFLKSGTSITNRTRISYNSDVYEVKEQRYDSTGHHITAILGVVE